MAAWLGLVSDSVGWSLVDTRRMDEIVQGMSHPTTQYPSVFSFIGNRNRMPALRSLFPHNNTTRRGPAGLVRLHLSTTTANTEYPVLFAESSLCDPSVSGECCNNPLFADHHRIYPVRGSKIESPVDLKRHVIRQLLFPWTHVVCLFVDNMIELKMARSLLEGSHTTMAAGYHTAPPSLMRAVIVLTNPTAACDTGLVHDLSESHFTNERLPPISILDLRDRHELSPVAAFDPLRRLLVDELHTSRAQRIQHGLLFSAFHLNFLWNRTLQQCVLTSSTVRIDSLQIARERLPVNTSFSDCLAEFLEQFSKAGCSADEIHSFVASAILMDAYPPGMHRE